MKQRYFLILMFVSLPALPGSFPHKTVIYQSVMSGPMTEVVTEHYGVYSDDLSEAMVAEWTTQKSMMKTTRRFSLKRDGAVYSLDLDSGRCTRTDVSGVTPSVEDPERLAKEMKSQMGLTKAGDCEGAGFPGTRYTSAFGEMCFYRDVFLLWQEGMGTSTRLTKVQFDTPLPKRKTSLPEGVSCAEGPDLSQGLGGLMSGGTASSEAAEAGRKETASDQETSAQQSESSGQMTVEQATEQAQEMMKKLGGLFKSN